jgi:serine/threonine protein kinase
VPFNTVIRPLVRHWGRSKVSNENRLIRRDPIQTLSMHPGDETISGEDMALGASTPAPLLTPESIAVDPARYALAGEHARGGLGRILQAHDVLLDRPVAVKELLKVGDEAEARFIREALITARLQHPAIVPVHDLGRSPEGKPFYTMKMVCGRSLAELIQQTRTLAERLALLPNIIAVADAMAYAHGRRVIHRDLKPSNILIGPFGETVVVDWGLAADLDEAKRRSRCVSTAYEIAASGLTVAGTVLGTPEYMPAEQAEGRSVDERADVYAIGAILYHLLAGAPPYEGNSSKEVLAKLVRREPIPVEKREPATPRELATIVRTAMARTPSDRYATAKELAADLERFRTGQRVLAHSYSPASLIWKSIRTWLRCRSSSRCSCARLTGLLQEKETTGTLNGLNPGALRSSGSSQRGDNR